MTLLDIIYDFFYYYIWTSSGETGARVFTLDGVINLFGEDIELAVYLSTVSAWIVMILLLVAVGLGVVWLFKSLVRLIVGWAL